MNPSLGLVQPRKTCPFITERLLMGRKESNQTDLFRLYALDFSTFLLDIEPQQCKFYASVMKSNLLDVQRLSLSSFMA